MDFAKVSQYFTLDVLSQIAFGTKFGFLNANRDLYDYNKTSASFLAVLELILNHPSIRWIVTSRPMQALLAPKSTDAIGAGKIIGIIKAAVAERYSDNLKDSSTPPKRDMLAHFKSKGLTREQTEVESHLQLIAGSDSTTSALRTTFFLLIANPPAYNRLNLEISDAISSNLVTDPVITATECQQLPYLQAVINEGLRLWPPLFGLQAKLSPSPNGETFQGRFYPPGTEVAICGLAMGRKKSVFGEDADLFKPERWMEDGGVSKERRQKYAEHVECLFGAGRFTCLGKPIAMMELGKGIVEVRISMSERMTDPIHTRWKHRIADMIIALL